VHNIKTLTPPNGYVHHGPLFSRLPSRSQNYAKRVLLGNFLAIIPLGMGIVGLWLPYQVYIALGLPLAFTPELSWPITIKLLESLLVFVASVFLHEELHAIALRLTGHKPRLSFKRGFLYATISEGDFLTRREYLFMTLIPVVVLTLAGVLALLILPKSAGEVLLVILLLNLAASTGDFQVAIWVASKSPGSLFADDGQIQVFVPARAQT
jgi:hypothetical protein